VGDGEVGVDVFGAGPAYVCPLWDVSFVRRDLGGQLTRIGSDEGHGSILDF
jgi:hypothetical protein